MTHGYRRLEENGVSQYVPLKLEQTTRLYDSGDQTQTKLAESHSIIDVLNFDCANVEVLAIKMMRSVSVNFVLLQMDFTFNGKRESCRLSPNAFQRGEFSSSCMTEQGANITLVFEQFGYDKFLPLVTW